MPLSHPVAAVLAVLFLTGLLLAGPVYGDDRGWTGTLSYAFLRNSPEPGEDEFHDTLSATLAGFWATSAHLSIGPEIGYHGVETPSGIQCGPEWAVGCPSPENLRGGVWEGIALVRWQSRTTGFRPYAVAGAGPYLAGNFVIESRAATIRHHLEPGVTAGLGVRVGFLGVEGRWHYVVDGVADSRYDGNNDVFTYSYSPLRIYSASVCANFH
jgi:hypothetical protein